MKYQVVVGVAHQDFGSLWLKSKETVAHKMVSVTIKSILKKAIASEENSIRLSS